MITTEQVQKFLNEGYLLVKSVYTKDEVAELIDEYDKIWVELITNKTIVQNPEQPLVSLFPRLRDYHRISSTVKSFVLKPAIFEIIEKLMGEEALIISTSYYYKAPGTFGLPCHQDNYAIGVSPGTTYAVWVSLDEATKENGGLIVVPGTGDYPMLSPKTQSSDVIDHFSDSGQTVTIPDNYSELHLHTSPGDVVIFTGNTIHGSSDNKSRHLFRRSIITHMAANSTDEVTLNFNNLLNKEGKRVRRRLNKNPKIAEPQGSVLSFIQADYFTNTGWK